MGLSSLPARQAEGGIDGNGLADSNLTVVLRKRNVIAMSMGTARKWFGKKFWIYIPILCKMN